MKEELGSLASRFVDIDTMPWKEPFPGIRVKVLYKDNRAKEALMLFETAPGTVIPEHVHGGVEWALMLEGSLADEEGACTKGNLVIRPAGSQHAPPTPNGAKYLGLFHGSAKSVATGSLFPEYDE